MKKVIFALGFLCLLNQSIGQVNLVYSIKTKDFDIKIPNLKNGIYGVSGGIESVSGALLYKVGNIEHIIQASADSLSPTLHFTREPNGDWMFENYYDTASVTGGFRNYYFVDTLGTIAFASTGTESQNPWPFGDLFLLKTRDKLLSWTKVSKSKTYYHSVGVGDLNNDGLFDLVGVHMGTYSNWGEEPHIYTQNPDSTFSEAHNFFDPTKYPGMVNGLGSTLVANLFGDSKPEIILAEYGFNSNNGNINNRKGFGIFTYDNQLNSYKYFSSPSDLGVYKNSSQGSTSIKTGDFNNDGKTDMAIATEGLGGNNIQIWIGDGLGNFSPGQILNYPEVPPTIFPDSSNNFREFEVMDFDKDGWLDIVVHPFHYGNQFRINPTPTNWRGNGITLQGSIWHNNKGNFKRLDNNLSIQGIHPGFMKGFFIDNKIRFFGFESKYNPSTPDRITLYDVSITICNYLDKPKFSNSKFSFCSNDSLKISISNVNKGDTLKWYYGNKTDFTNVSNKTFTDSTKLFVTRTDSLGCVISSDSVQLVKYAIPSAPILSRDTANNIVANTNGITWYKDGTILSDTTQKIKPTTGGSYTVKTTQNGCTSTSSVPYYYLVTDVINLSADEFIKLAPNPFSNQLNFDFVVKGYQRLNIEVFDIATGSKVATKQNLTPGMPIYLGSLSSGVGSPFLVQIKSII